MDRERRVRGAVARLFTNEVEERVQLGKSESGDYANQGDARERISN